MNIAFTIYFLAIPVRKLTKLELVRLLVRLVPADWNSRMDPIGRRIDRMNRGKG
jgi:hypothetical protein